MEQRSLAAILFDLDGTLIDSIELILRSYEHTLEAHGKEAVERGRLVTSLGIPLSTHLSEFSADAAEVEAMVITYRAFNHAHHDELVEPYPGVAQALEALTARAVPLAIVTSKGSEMAWRGLRLCGIAEHFDVLVGFDDVDRHKPDPMPVLVGCERLGLEASSCAYVGDSVHDMAAACAAGARAVGAGWGPFDHDDLCAAGAAPLLTDPAQMVELA
ncbi:MAG: HAD family hydrolase [Planctomycetes bacterium]|nr:HAD family hydrolase [Planctomycetota bacterium]